jgi:putative transcriptional regulator
MPIKYTKLIEKMQAAGFNTYKIKAEKIIGTATYTKILEGGNIDTKTIAKLCEYFDCQPGDLLEYEKE